MQKIKIKNCDKFTYSLLKQHIENNDISNEDLFNIFRQLLDIGKRKCEYYNEIKSILIKNIDLSEIERE